MEGLALLLTLASAPPLASATPPAIQTRQDSEAVLHVGRRKFSLPIVDYRAPDGTWKHGHGIIIGRDVAPNATVGVGFFKIKPRSDETTRAPLARKSSKVSLGFSLRF